MSRHRAVKKQIASGYDYDDDYYDDYEDDYGVSPSPSTQSYMYNYKRSSTGSAPRPSLWDSVKHASGGVNGPASSPGDGNGAASGNNGDGSSAGDVGDEELQLTQAPMEALYELLGPSLGGHTPAHCRRLLLKHSLDVEQVADQLLSGEQQDNDDDDDDYGGLGSPSPDTSIRSSSAGVFDLELGGDGNAEKSPSTNKDTRKAGHGLTGGGVFVLGSPKPAPLESPAQPKAAAEEAIATSASSLSLADSSRGDRSYPAQRTAQRQKELEKLIQASTAATSADDIAWRKRHFNLVVIGHVDAGKSTINGHLLYLMGRVSDRQMRGFEKQSKAAGKGSFSFAWVMDEHAEERSRGVTVDVGVNSFETDHCLVTLLDAPGHRDFIPNMITGAAQADVAVLVLDATTGEFESGFREDGQTREHAILARSLGVRLLIVAVNKMDSVDWSQDRYDHVCAEVHAFLRQAGFKERQLVFLPVSGLTGSNLTKPLASGDGSAAAAPWSWYTGPTLLEAIDQFDPAIERQAVLARPFRMAISDVYKSRSQSTATVAGKLESGFVFAGDRLLLAPSNEIVTVKTILSHERSFEYAQMGENVDLIVTGVDVNAVRVGDVLCDPEHPLIPVTTFRAQIIVLAGIRIPVIKGTACMFHCHVTSAAARISRLVAELDRASGATVRKKPRRLVEGQAAIVDITTSHSVCIELYSKYQQLGRFMLRAEGRSIAAGIVIDLKFKK